MAGICVYLDTEDSGMIDLDAWRAAAALASDIDTLAIINHPMEPIHSPDDPMGLCLYANINQFLDDHRDRSMVHVDTSADRDNGSVPLWQFDHDIDWYLFGPDGGAGLGVGTVISMPRPGQMKLPATQIASTVLLHRHWVRQGGAG